ncbi:hypothetical protein GCM10009665_10070 [Kitasatospora nipponensis]|uniref:Thioredoxin domain-containing protein n=1 Tax=Kitasatospora nipponensis TaxID=258049 RepID=A0ABN1VSN9_9ACTN
MAPDSPRGPDGTRRRAPPTVNGAERPALVPPRPALVTLTADLEHRLAVAKWTSTPTRGAATAYQVLSWPTLHLFVDGRIVATTIAGVKTAAARRTDQPCTLPEPTHPAAGSSAGHSRPGVSSAIVGGR